MRRASSLCVDLDQLAVSAQPTSPRVQRIERCVSSSSFHSAQKPSADHIVVRLQRAPNMPNMLPSKGPRISAFTAEPVLARTVPNFVLIDEVLPPKLTKPSPQRVERQPSPMLLPAALISRARKTAGGISLLSTELTLEHKFPNFVLIDEERPPKLMKLSPQPVDRPPSPVMLPPAAISRARPPAGGISLFR